MNKVVSHTDTGTMPLDQIDVSDPRMYQQDAWRPIFSRLRQEEPGALPER